MCAVIPVSPFVTPLDFVTSMVSKHRAEFIPDSSFGTLLWLFYVCRDLELFLFCVWKAKSESARLIDISILK